jgi:hypothetical protein
MSSYWDAVEPHFTHIDIYEGCDRYKRGMAAVPEAVRHLFATHWLVSEVCNGGFAQFFYNSTGIVAPEAVEGFRAMRCNGLADIVEKAMREFPSPYPREREVRIRHLAANGMSTSPWDGSLFLDQDERFYEALGSSFSDGDVFTHAANAYAEHMPKRRK